MTAEWTGTQFVTDPTWGDNGKGKVVDLFAQDADMVVRTNGGPNAGHTVTNEKGKFAFHLVPSGIFNPNAICVLADTVVINPTSLVEEIRVLREAGVEVGNNLLVSRNAHLIMPWHRTRDRLRETARGGEKIGTTGQGIGPAYADRSERVGLTVGNLFEPDFIARFDKELQWQERLSTLMAPSPNGRHFDREAILDELCAARETLAPMVREVIPVIWEYHYSGKKLLAEAGQGVMLDLDRGGYPYVTSSHPGIAGFNLATGIPPREVTRVIGVTKAYTTRVGEGPLPTELHGEIGREIRERGVEYGATTGRPRRCGWLDLPAVRYGARVGGVDALALTKIDIFDGFSEIKVCTGYEIGGRTYPVLPTANVRFLAEAKPIYETLPGWSQSISSCRRYCDLPTNARNFIERVQEITGLPIDLISVGPEREASIYH